MTNNHSNNGSSSKGGRSRGGHAGGRDTLISALLNHRHHLHRFTDEDESVPPFSIQFRERIMRAGPRRSILPNTQPVNHGPDQFSVVDPAMILRTQQLARRLWLLGGTTPQGESRTFSRADEIRVLEEALEISSDDHRVADVDTTTRDNDHHQDPTNHAPL